MAGGTLDSRDDTVSLAYGYRLEGVMRISLNPWDAPSGGYTLIYVNGLPIEGKVYLQGSKGRTLVKFKGDSGEFTADRILDMVAEVAGCDVHNFEELLIAARSMPQPKRGPRTGSTAASARRGGGELFRPGRKSPRRLDSGTYPQSRSQRMEGPASRRNHPPCGPSGTEGNG